MEKHKVKQQCVQLLDQNRSIEEIAEDLKLAKTEVKTYLGEDVLVRKAMDMHFKDMEVLDISNYLSTKETTIEKWLTPEIEFSFIEIEIQKDIISDLTKGISFSSIAEKYSINKDFIKEYRKKQVICDYIQLHSMKTIEKSYKLARRTIKTSLESMNITTHIDTDMTKLVQHIDGGNWKYWHPHDELNNSRLIGILLGDGKFVINSIRPYFSSLSDYKNAKEFFEWIKSNIFYIKTNDIDLSKIIDQFNRYSMLIIQTPTALLRLDKSIVEENWVSDININLSNLGYKTNYKVGQKKDKEKNRLVWHVTLDTRSSVQLYDLYCQFYNNGSRIIPENFQINENILLYLYIGDGTFAGHKLAIATDNFYKCESEILAKSIESVSGVRFRVYPKKDKRYPGKINNYLQISSKHNINRFFEYLENADPKSLSLAKTEFPWKFNSSLTKKEALKQKSDQDHIRKYNEFIPID